MTIIIIVLIIKGNRRSFYHEKVSRMQSGILTFMAEVVENRDDNTGGHIRCTAAYVECIAKKLKRRMQSSGRNPAWKDPSICTQMIFPLS